MLTLIICLFQDFIYVQYKKQKKNILLIKQRKYTKKKIIKYIESQYIPFNLLKMKIELQIEITRKQPRDVLKPRREKKMDEMKEREK